LAGRIKDEVVFSLVYLPTGFYPGSFLKSYYTSIDPTGVETGLKEENAMKTKTVRP